MLHSERTEAAITELARLFGVGRDADGRNAEVPLVAVSMIRECTTLYLGGVGSEPKVMAQPLAMIALSVMAIARRYGIDLDKEMEAAGAELELIPGRSATITDLRHALESFAPRSGGGSS